MSMVVSKDNKFTFTWNIYNFSLCYYEKNQALISPKFVAKSIKATQWFLKLYPRGQTSDQFIACYLWRCKSEEEIDEINIKCKIDFLNKGGILHSCQSNKVTFQKNTGRGLPNFVLKDDVWECIKASDDDTLTVKCHMTEAKLEPASICIGWTKFCAERHSFKWPLKYNSRSFNESHKFQCGEPWQITVISNPSSDDISIEIQKINGNDNPRAVQCEVSLLDVNGFKIQSRKSDHFFKPNNSDLWSFPEFFTKSELMSAKYHYVEDDTFTLKIQFSVSNGTVLEEIECYDNDNSNISHPLNNNNDACIALQEDLQRMYLEHLGSDIKLKCESETFQAHKSILSVRSSVFATMFQQDMLENQTGVVDILDVEVTTLDSFLRFVYSGVVEGMDCEEASKLLAVAEKYQVISLKEECSSFLKSILTTENVCDVLVAACMGRAEDLTSAVVDFMATHAEIVLQSDAWYRCVKENVMFATETLCKLSAKLGNSNSSSK